MSLRSAPEPARASRRQRLRAWFTPSRRAAKGRLPVPREDRTVYPPKQHVELRFQDGSAKVIDPRSPDAEALQRLAHQLRQSGS